MATIIVTSEESPEPLYTPAEVARLFRVDPKTVTRWAAQNWLSSVRTPGGHRRYLKTEIDSLLRTDGKPAPGPGPR